ncbi:unnamed protein product [Brassica oleracea var. botrytis]
MEKNDGALVKAFPNLREPPMKSLRREPSSSFLLLLNFVDSKFSAQSARVGIVRDGSTNLGRIWVSNIERSATLVQPWLISTDLHLWSLSI